MTNRLALAAYRGDVELVKSIVTAGANPNEALAHAALYGHLELAEYLVSEAGVDPNEALKYAAQGGHIELVKYLVEEAGADVHFDNDYALRWATLCNHLVVMKYLTDFQEVECKDISAVNENDNFAAFHLT